jgi:hypothetical protein
MGITYKSGVVTTKFTPTPPSGAVKKANLKLLANGGNSASFASLQGEFKQTGKNSVQCRLPFWAMRKTGGSLTNPEFIGGLYGTLTLKTVPTTVHPSGFQPFIKLESPPVVNHNQPDTMLLAVDPKTGNLIYPQSDYYVTIEFDSSTFDTSDFGSGNSLMLNIPWELFAAADSKDSFAVYCDIQWQSQAQAKNDPMAWFILTSGSDILDLPTLNSGVKAADDVGDYPAPTGYYGLSTVYPTNTFTLTGARVPFGNNKLNIYLSNNFMFACARAANYVNPPVTNDQYNFAKIQQYLVELFSEAGFPRGQIKVQQLDDTIVNNYFVASGCRNFASKNVAKGTVDPNTGALNAADPTEYVSLPFFDFYVVAESAVARAHNNEVAESETLMVPVNASSGQKNVLTPICLMSGEWGPGGTPFNEIYGRMSPDDRPKVLAQVIAHEIGHTFGFAHAIWVDPSGDATVLSRHGVGAMGCVSALTPTPAPRYGPVHKGLIKSQFL